MKLLDMDAKPLLSQPEADTLSAIADCLMTASKRADDTFKLEFEFELALPMALVIAAGIEALTGNEE